VNRFRFGFQLGATIDAAELRANARAAEAAGFDVVHSFDHVDDAWSPLAPLLAIADATEHIRVCPLVVNNDFHHPVQLAREIAAMDQLTGGRVELGIGAGHSFTEYQALGLPFSPPARRKARLAESVEILRRLLDGEEVTHNGEFYQLERVRTMRSAQERLPILVGVNGKAALAHAARHADIIGLTMLGRTHEDGQRHSVRWEPERLDQTVAHVRAEAGDRAEAIELNALVQVVAVTDDRQGAAAAIAERIDGLTPTDALTTAYLAIGTHDEIAEHLVECRRRWGISYLSVRDIDAFAPVIERLREVDRSAGQ
jgi:probable F420-dependent oxidoreductase